MAFCSNCGRELQAEEKFCPSCGTSVETENVVDEVNVEEVKTPSVPKCFTIFAKLGYIFGLVSFIISFIPFVNILACELGPVGIVFSILGKKDPFMILKSKKGLKLSIWGTVLGIVLYFIYTIIIALLASA